EGWHIDDVQVLVPGTQPAGFSINNVTVKEGNDGTTQATFTVTRSSGGGNAPVHLAPAHPGARAAPGDFLALSGALSLPPRETSKTVTVLVNGGRRGEADESFFVNLSNATGAVIAHGQGKATILDDEPRILVTVPVPVFEGNEEQPVLLAVDLSVPSSQTV